jgi:hypothetical protein
LDHISEHCLGGEVPIGWLRESLAAPEELAAWVEHGYSITWRARKRA